MHLKLPSFSKVRILLKEKKLQMGWQFGYDRDLVKPILFFFCLKPCANYFQKTIGQNVIWIMTWDSKENNKNKLKRNANLQGKVVYYKSKMKMWGERMKMGLVQRRMSVKAAYCNVIDGNLVVGSVGKLLNCFLYATKHKHNTIF